MRCFVSAGLIRVPIQLVEVVFRASDPSFGPRPEKKSHGNAPSCHERTLTGLLALLHRESPVERLETAFTRR